MVTVEGQWVEFKFFRPSADRVYIVGEFNDWREQELLMAFSSDGYWAARMRLPSGEFKFRYNADGEWFTDYAAFVVEPGRFGFDSIVCVPKAPARTIQPGLVAQPAETAAA